MKKNDLKEISIILLATLLLLLKTAPDNQEVYEMVIHSDALPSKLDTGYKPIFYKKYKIQPNDLLKCVKCPRCKILPMAKTKGSWLCGNCQYTSKMLSSSPPRFLFFLDQRLPINNAGISFNYIQDQFQQIYSAH